MLIREIVQRFQTAYSLQVNEETIPSARRIYSKVKTLRSKLLSQQSNKNQLISLWNFQTIECIEMIPAAPHECPCVADMGYNILRSKFKIPRPITDIGRHKFKPTTGLDGVTTYHESTLEARLKKKGAKYTSKEPDLFYHNGYVWINTKLFPELIPLTGLYEDPLEVERFRGECCNLPDDCKSNLDFDFPIDTSMFDTILEMGIAELIGRQLAPKQPTQQQTQNVENE